MWRLCALEQVSLYCAPLHHLHRRPINFRPLNSSLSACKQADQSAQRAETNDKPLPILVGMFLTFMDRDPSMNERGRLQGVALARCGSRIADRRRPG